jgi:iron complex outermembrane receptor protein
MRPPTIAGSLRLILATSASLTALQSQARAQDATELPGLVVEARKKQLNATSTRLDTASTSAGSGVAAGASTTANWDGLEAASSGITGASTTVITRAQIERSPQATLADIIGREAGVQTSSLYGGVNGAGTTVDLRGFGVTGPSNTLVLINGRRLNDWDLPGFDLSTIAKESIERIEITRGNSGAVLYGDGAVGGVINIVTRAGIGLPNQTRVEGGVGSFASREGNFSTSGTSGVFSYFVSGNAFYSDGYRDNNETQQKSAVGDFRWTFAKGSVYLNIAADDQKLGLPGPRNITALLDQLRDDRRGTNTPFDYADKQGARGTLGFTYMLQPGVEAIVDGGVRTKAQQAGFFPRFFDSYLDTNLTTTSLTPRLSINQPLFGLRSRILTGIDFYDTDYQSDRSRFKGEAPIHIYNGGQQTLAAYGQDTVSISPTTDLSAGGRIQQNKTTASDTFDPTAPNNGPFTFSPPGVPLDKTETNHAWHLGVEQNIAPGLILFARAAQSFRVANIDERIGASPVFVPTNFDLRTQKSHDWEAGLRLRFGTFNIQSSYYAMQLTDEIHFDPVNFVNTNLDPTRRQGVETIANWQLTQDVRLRGNLTYTDAEFRSGPFAGNKVPMVSPWTGNAGVSWNIIGPQLWIDAGIRYFSERYLDGDEINAKAVFKVPTTTLVDLKVGGEKDHFFWSAAAQNLFDRKYYDYGLDASSPGFPFYSFYPQPGRTVVLKAGTTW